MRKHSSDIIEKMISMRRNGHSYPEISRSLGVPKTTVLRYVTDIEILPEYYDRWLDRNHLGIGGQQDFRRGTGRLGEFASGGASLVSVGPGTKHRGTGWGASTTPGVAAAWGFRSSQFSRTSR